MNLLRVIVIGIGLFAGLPALAMTLQLPQNMELLVVDGTPVSGTLLRDAGSLELTRGSHRLVFTLGKKFYGGHDRPEGYRPFYLIVLFDTWNARRLRFQLPTLVTPAEIDRFISLPVLTLLDEHDAPVSTAYSRLPVGNEGLMAALRNHERRYGASILQPGASPALEDNPASNAGITPSRRDGTLGQIEQMLRFCFPPSGENTRPPWLEWVRRHYQDPVVR